MCMCHVCSAAFETESKLRQPSFLCFPGGLQPLLFIPRCAFRIFIYFSSKWWLQCLLLRTSNSSQSKEARSITSVKCLGTAGLYILRSVKVKTFILFFLKLKESMLLSRTWNISFPSVPSGCPAANECIGLARWKVRKTLTIRMVICYDKVSMMLSYGWSYATMRMVKCYHQDGQMLR